MESRPPVFSAEQQAWLRDLFASASATSSTQETGHGDSLDGQPSTREPISSGALGDMPENIPQLPLFSQQENTNSGLDGLNLLAAVTGASTSSNKIPSQHKLSSPGPFNPAATLPPKIVKRILDLDFVEMSELSIDAWDESASPESGQQRRPSRRVPITDINLWLESYGRMAALLCSRFPEKAPELWAYQSSIVRAARNFEGTAWVPYDRQYRREALANKDLNWSVPNTRLFNESIPRCQHCVSELHPSHLCPVHPNPPITTGWFQPSNTSHWPSRGNFTYKKSGDSMVCRNWNNNRCSYPKCRYIHHCSGCSQSHPFTHCPLNPANQLGHSRSPAAQGPRQSYHPQPLMGPP